MRTSRVFVERQLTVGDTIELSDAPAHYLRNVLRLGAGDGVVLFNGEGGEYTGSIANVGRNRIQILIMEFVDVERESALRVNLGIAVIKRDAMDNVLQKSTELGVSSVTPIVSAFTSASRKSLDKRHGHWLQVIRSACEQCGRNRPPQLLETSGLADWINRSTSPLKLIAHPGSGVALGDIASSERSIDILVGPEGGFDDNEVELATTSGFQAISLGPRILRADTAPLALISLLQAKWGDLR